DDDVRELEEASCVAPEMDLAERVEADDEEEGSARLGTRELVERVDGIGITAALELEWRDGERRISRDRKSHHLEPKRAVGELLRRFARLDGGRHEQHAIEAHCFAHFLGGTQMAEVNGIEGTAEDADPHVRI